jgi:hypothetical protein
MTREQKIDYLVLSAVLMTNAVPGRQVREYLAMCEATKVYRSALLDTVQRNWTFAHALNLEARPLIWEGRLYRFN